MARIAHRVRERRRGKGIASWQPIEHDWLTLDCGEQLKVPCGVVMDDAVRRNLNSMLVARGYNASDELLEGAWEGETCVT